VGLTGVQAGEQPRAPSRSATVAVVAGGNVAGVTAIFAIWWLHRAGLMAPTPYPVLVGLIVSCSVVDVVLRLWHRRRPGSRFRAHVRLASAIVTTTAVLYASGWGSAFAIGYALCSAQLFAQVEGANWKFVFAACVLGVAVGEGAVELGIAPSMLPNSLSHVVAVVGIAALAGVLWIVGNAFAARDAGERALRERERRLAIEAATDSLTGLANRSAFMQALDAACAAQSPVVLAFVDLDNFKDVNDSFGHHVGDQTLVELAARLRRVVGSDDLVARIGGDEFAVLVRDPAGSGAGDAAAPLLQRLRSVIAEPWPMIAPNELSAGIGVVSDCDGLRSPGDLLRDADEKMYARKHGMSSGSMTAMTSRALAYHRRAMDGMRGGFTVLRAVRQGDAVVDWEVVEANSITRRQFESRGIEMVGARTSTLNQYFDNSAFERMALDALARRSVVSGEVRRSLASGKEVWLKTAVVPVDRDVVAIVSHDNTAEVEARGALERERGRLAAVAESISDVIAICDADGRIVWVSGAVRELLGVEPAGVVGLSAFEIMHPDDHARVASRLVEVIGGNTERRPIDLRLRHGDGSYRWFEATGTNRIDDPSIAGVVVSLRDVTGRRAAEDALRVSEERNRVIVEAAGDAIVTVGGGVVQSFNRAAERIFGLSRDEAIGQPYTKLLPADALDALRASLDEDFVGEHIDVIAARASGERFHAQVSISRVDVGGTTLFVAVLRDVSEERAMEEALRSAALHDELTGLPNRRLLLDRTEAAIDVAASNGGCVGLVFIDLDRFKLVNDGLGHDVGDQLLVLVADRIASVVRAGDVIARLGGDEFAVLCPNAPDLDAVTAAAERIITALERPFSIVGGDVFVRASVGVSVWNGTETPLELLRCADVAMYRAKGRGTSQVELFDDEMHREIAARLDLESSLRHAVDQDELVAYYQPIVDLDTGDVSQLEALVRWDRPGVGLVGPHEFIEVAEDARIVVQLGEWMLHRAAADCARWQELVPGVGVSVNVSARQFDGADFDRTVASALDASGLAPELLTLEITESVMLAHTERNVAIMQRIRDLGVHIALDDFGSGYSSLTYVRRLPIDSIKIDRSFLQSLTPGADVVMLRSIVDLGTAHGLAVVAEGIDTQEKLNAVRAVGCRFGQGFLFSQPKPVDEMLALVAVDRAMSVPPAS
jgi:diguanylate cyclase (GGDEF)-like protein/PAS domain S-box-containing protein